MVDKYKNTWLDKLPEALRSYRTSVRIATQATQYSLVLRGEAIHSLEIQLPSLRVAHPLTNDE